jgi:hypothetical protein
MSELRALFEFADKQSVRIFRQNGRILPMYHAITEDGTNFVTPPFSDNKDEAVAVIRAMFQVRKVVRYVFIDEAWILDITRTGIDEADLDRITRAGLEHHPDRREILMLCAEDRSGARMMGHRFILRPEHGKPKLSPLTMLGDGQTEGRMVGLLQREGKAS